MPLRELVAAEPDLGPAAAELFEAGPRQDRGDLDGQIERFAENVAREREFVEAASGRSD